MKNGKMKGGKGPSIMIAVAIPSRQAKTKAEERKKKKMEEAAEMKKEKMETKAYEAMIKVAKGAKSKPKKK